jgi:translation elongation factor EF-Ts
MSEISLEKIDIIKERTGATYGEAKEALEACEGNVVDALIYIEKNQKSNKENLYTTKDEFVAFIKQLINKGNITRIKIKKDEKVIVDVPVNAGVATGALALIWPPLFALIGIGTLAAVATDFTIEITKEDGSVEVVSKIIKGTMQDVKEKVNGMASEVKEKFSQKKQENNHTGTDNVYKYTVKFDDIEEGDK